MFVYAAKLTSCSSMAVGVEAEVSATKRSQVEVTKILPGRKKKQTEDSIKHSTVTVLSFTI